MDGVVVIIIFAVIVIALSGPAALIIALVALNKVNRLIESQRQGVSAIQQPIPQVYTPPVPVKQTELKPVEASKPVEKPQPVISPPVEQKAPPQIKVKPPKPKESLEQRIGTKWILVAGIITVIFGCGFFLRYAFVNKLIGPLGQVVITAICGVIALIIGEITRRRGYGVVAKGTTALGFAVLYASVFTAYRFYNLIDTVPAFGLAISVTAAAMLYAVILNDELIAFLSLLGGYMTPVLVSTGENLPMSLFSYVLVLSLGAMFSSFYRKWRTINWLCFIGTFTLYIGWFEKFYRDGGFNEQGHPVQMSIALGWLCVFFVVYLIMPLLHEFAKKVIAKKEDVVLIVANALLVLYYLCNIFYDDYQTALAISVAVVGIIHLLLMIVSSVRIPKDSNLKIALLVLGLLFITIAIPLYYELYAVSICWAVKAVIVTLIGIRYRSRICQLSGMVSIALSIINLLHRLPIHSDIFDVFINPEFGTWTLVSAAVIVIHLLYRFSKSFDADINKAVSQLTYLFSVIMVFTAIALEWYFHTHYNLSSRTGDIYFMRVMLLMLSITWILLLLRPICTGGTITTAASIVTVAAALPFALSTFTEVYQSSFIIFANIDFAIGLVFIWHIFLAAILIKNQHENDKCRYLFSTCGIVALWLLLTLQIYHFWYCRDKYLEPVANWNIIANMYISVMWAIYAVVLMLIGFIRKAPILRYMALGLLALLLGKIFIYDTKKLESIYRISAFLATGITMVGVSYLYQFLKKKGFFDSLLSKLPSEQ